MILSVFLSRIKVNKSNHHEIIPILIPTLFDLPEALQEETLDAYQVLSAESKNYCRKRT